MHGEVTMHINASPERLWALVSDVTNMGRWSPETYEAEWVDGATGPGEGVRFRGHNRRGRMGFRYWTKCTIVECDPGQTFSFRVGPSTRMHMRWTYRFEAANGGGTDVTESWDFTGPEAMGKVLGLGAKRAATLGRSMRTTLENLQVAAAESTGA
jgi:uncharacterized protein YndB with AHSA1/START domain